MQLTVLFAYLFFTLTAIASPTEVEKRMPSARGFDKRMPSARGLGKREPYHNVCPEEHTVCGVSSSWSRNAWECIDTARDLESCGGCVYALPDMTASGVDCTTIEGVEDVACLKGSCMVYTCRYGYSPSEDRKSCVAAGERGGHHHAGAITY